MHLVDQKFLGIAIILLLGMLIISKRVATGSIFDRPEGCFLVQFVNIFNLFFLLIVNPAAAVILIARRLEVIDPSHVALGAPLLLAGLEGAGLLLYAEGFFLMAWALLSLSDNYQLGGSVPRSTDKMISKGPYRFIRHPMYSAALSISIGLACLTQSIALFTVFCVYLMLILLLIPLEERGLQQAYSKEYLVYLQGTARLLPFIF
jgi:protein-S-isoprenylcysteine O-methyltransferase Ste14